MTYISHRGNLNGPEINLENNPSQIKTALSRGFDCEIDVWFINNHFLLGHDGPSHAVKEAFLENKKLWCHAKNLAALEKMSANKLIHCFWHDQDRYTLTSRGYIWTATSQPIEKKSVIVRLEPPAPIGSKSYGICTDYPILFQE